MSNIVSLVHDDVVEPAAEVVEPEAEVVEPESDVVEPESEVVEPEPEVVESDAEVVEPDGDFVDEPYDDPDDEVVNPEDVDDVDEPGVFVGERVDEAVVDVVDSATESQHSKSMNENVPLVDRGPLTLFR
jgi:hypothetical protein